MQIHSVLVIGAEALGEQWAKAMKKKMNKRWKRNCLSDGDFGTIVKMTLFPTSVSVLSFKLRFTG